MGSDLNKEVPICAPGVRRDELGAPTGDISVLGTLTGSRRGRTIAAAAGCGVKASHEPLRMRGAFPLVDCGHAGNAGARGRDCTSRWRTSAACRARGARAGAGTQDAPRGVPPRTFRSEGDARGAAVERASDRRAPYDNDDSAGQSDISIVGARTAAARDAVPRAVDRRAPGDADRLSSQRAHATIPLRVRHIRSCLPDRAAPESRRASARGRAGESRGGIDAGRIPQQEELLRGISQEHRHNAGAIPIALSYRNSRRRYFFSGMSVTFT